jgi:predicted phosphoribosyltransferase
VLVLALPRGGVPVGFEVARALSAPLDVFLVRKLGVPGREELAMGAIASGGILILNEDIVHRLGISERLIQDALMRERRELERREALYRRGRTPLDVAGRTVVIVDDGLATGSSMRAAAAALQQRSAGRIVVAVPVAPPDTLRLIQAEVDEVDCVSAPESFFAVGSWYQDFAQTSDAEVCDLLDRAEREWGSHAAPGPSAQ